MVATSQALAQRRCSQNFRKSKAEWGRRFRPELTNPLEASRENSTSPVASSEPPSCSAAPSRITFKGQEPKKLAVPLLGTQELSSPYEILRAGRLRSEHLDMLNSSARWRQGALEAVQETRRGWSALTGEV